MRNIKDRMGKIVFNTKIAMRSDRNGMEQNMELKRAVQN